MENLIYGAIYLDSAKLRATLIMPLVEGIVHIPILVMNLFLCLPINSSIVLQPTYTSLLDRLFKVNGQPIFIRGGNWILSDGLLRLSKKRYQTDIKFHADMNMNMIRCWGGGLAERPEFYHYCDIYGLLVNFASLSLSLSVCALRSHLFFCFYGWGVGFVIWWKGYVQGKLNSYSRIRSKYMTRFL